jgi:hypothetical protein
MLIAIPLGFLIGHLLTRRSERASLLMKLVNESDRNGSKSRLDMLNDLVNIDRNKKNASLMRSYGKFISDHGSTEINAVHQTLSEAGVRDPSRNMTVGQIVAADRIIKELINQEVPSVEWEYHPLTSHAVMHVADADLLVSIIQRGVTDHEQALQLLAIMKASPATALLDGSL